MSTYEFTLILASDPQRYTSMGRTQPVKETILERAKANPKFRAALIGEALESIAENDVPTAKALIRDYVLASIGFEALAKEPSPKTWARSPKASSEC